MFIDADQHALLFLAHVEGVAGAAHHRYSILAVRQVRHVISDEIHMLHRNDRIADPDHPAHLVGTIAGRDDDMFCVNVTLAAVYGPFVVRLLGQTGHRRVAMDFRAGQT